MRTVEVYVNGVVVTTWTSLGTTNGFESIDLSGTSGTTIEIVGVLGDSEWLSIIEVSRLAVEYSVGCKRNLVAVKPYSSLYCGRDAVWYLP